MVHRKKPDLPDRPAPIVAALRRARQTMVEIQMGVAIGGPAYRAAGGVMKAIDELATVLTGDAEYFWAGPGFSPIEGAGHGRSGSHDKKLAREAGELPWRRVDEPVRRP